MGTASNPASEYDGTDGNGGEPVIGASVDPAALAGAGSGDANGDDFNPDIHVGRDKRNVDGSYTRKRGRKAGAGTGSQSGGAKASSKASDLKGSIEQLSKSLMIIHVGIAGVTSTPELALDKDEADLLAGATANVLEQFDIKPDPKTQAVVGLVTAAGMIYAPRVYMIRERKTNEARAREANKNAGLGIGTIIDN